MVIASSTWPISVMNAGARAERAAGARRSCAMNVPEAVRATGGADSATAPPAKRRFFGECFGTAAPVDGLSPIGRSPAHHRRSSGSWQLGGPDPTFRAEDRAHAIGRPVLYAVRRELPEPDIRGHVARPTAPSTTAPTRGLPLWDTLDARAGATSGRSCRMRRS